MSFPHICAFGDHDRDHCQPDRGDPRVEKPHSSIHTVIIASPWRDCAAPPRILSAASRTTCSVTNAVASQASESGTPAPRPPRLCSCRSCRSRRVALLQFSSRQSSEPAWSRSARRGDWQLTFSTMLLCCWIACHQPCHAYRGSWFSVSAASFVLYAALLRGPAKRA